MGCDPPEGAGRLYGWLWALLSVQGWRRRAVFFVVRAFNKINRTLNYVWL
jgi:hypothetical protein